jgi:hypothetical protein
MNPTRLTALLFVLSFGAAPLTAVDARAQSGGTIDACVHVGSSTLRIINAPAGCRANEVLVTWNVAGPQGPQGDPGPQGPAGLTEVYAPPLLPGTNQVLCNQAQCETTLATLSVPAGKYVIWAKAVISHWTTGNTAPTSFCYIAAGPLIVDAFGATTTPQVTVVPGSLQAAATLVVPGQIRLYCANNFGETAAQNWKLMAIKVGEV